MKVAIRVDASERIGTGHVMRCLILGEEFRSLGAKVIFICREHPGNLCDLIELKGFTVRKLHGVWQEEDIKSASDIETQPPHAHWLGSSWEKDANETTNVILQEKVDSLVVDHFGIDARWERKVRDLASVNIGVIDGQLDRPHNCNFLLDPNLTKYAEHRWEKLLLPDCHLFLGPRYAFLRPEFMEENSKPRFRDGYIRKILIAFGGVDKNNATGKALETVSKFDLSGIILDVVIGPENPYKEKLEISWDSYPNVNFHIIPSNMAKLMCEADMAIGAGGTMAWERCFLGLPAILISIADNQQENCQSIAREGAAIYLGQLEEVKISSIFNSIDFMIQNPEAVCEMAYNSKRIMENSGTGLKEFCKAIMQ